MLTVFDNVARGPNNEQVESVFYTIVLVVATMLLTLPTATLQCSRFSTYKRINTH